MVTKHLKRLEKSGLIRLAQAQPGHIYSSRHSLIREMTYHSRLKNDRKRLHRAVAQAQVTAHLHNMCGESFCLKGLQGARGYPFQSAGQI